MARHTAMAAKPKTTLSIGGILLAVLAAIFYPKGKDQPTTPDTPSTPTVSQPEAAPPAPSVATP